MSGVPEKPGEAHVGAKDSGSAPDSGDGTDGAEKPGTGATHRATPSQEAAATVPSEVSRRHAANPGTERSAGPMLRILPLGSGLVLIGLGLGLAFVGLRLRRS
ncbi:hypothetical protein ACFPZI_06960 [Streptomyces chlorus]|uniref:Uncharacterized protein n=1 Tax=Streptomyces chlorus TaxID=887452 RepID=A0ABW1DSH4_9ACTN